MGCSKNGVLDKSTGLCDTCNGVYGSCKVNEHIVPEISYTLLENGANGGGKLKKETTHRCPSCHSEGECQSRCDLR